MNHVWNLIRAGVSIEADTKAYKINVSKLTLTFTIPELMHTENDQIRQAFTEFIADLDAMEDYGLYYKTSLFSRVNGTRVSFALYWSALTFCRGTIHKMKNNKLALDVADDYAADHTAKAIEDDIELHDTDLAEALGKLHRKNIQ